MKIGRALDDPFGIDVRAPAVLRIGLGVSIRLDLAERARRIDVLYAGDL